MSLQCPKEQYDARYEICKSCQHFKKKVRLCGLCGCFMPAKVRLKAATCPAGKWPIVNNEKNSGTYQGLPLNKNTKVHDE